MAPFGSNVYSLRVKTKLRILLYREMGIDKMEVFGEVEDTSL